LKERHNRFPLRLPKSAAPQWARIPQSVIGTHAAVVRI
jgi:hypothetical protein